MEARTCDVQLMPIQGFNDDWLSNRCALPCRFICKIVSGSSAMVADQSEYLEDVFLPRCRTKDAKTKEKGAQLAAKESEIL